MKSQHAAAFAVLGLPSIAGRDQIDHAYRVLLRRYHPDTRAPASAAAQTADNAALQQVIDAYRALADFEPDIPMQPTSRPTAPRGDRSPWLHTPGTRSSPIRAGPVRWRPSPKR